jgi:tetratricopeptide (TPR) repeat protein
MVNLGRYDEAIEFFDKAIKMDAEIPLPGRKASHCTSRGAQAAVPFF